MTTLSINDAARFFYADQTIEVMVKFRSKEQVYLEVIHPSDPVLPSPEEGITLHWQWQATYWQQPATVQRVDQSAVPLIIVAVHGDPEAVENRRNRRYYLRIPVVISQGTFKIKKITTETEDVSVNGLRCVVPTAFDEGSTLTFSLQLPARNAKLTGTVLRCHQIADGKAYEMAVLFGSANRDYHWLETYLHTQS